MTLKLSFVIISFFFVQQLFAHPMGLAVSDLRYSKGELSFLTRIFYSDFYYEFQQNATAKNKDYEKKGIDKTDKKDLIQYFKKNIQIWVNNKLVHFDNYTFKFEPHEDVFIFVVEMKGKAKIIQKSKIKIRDMVLLNSIGGQKQIINVYLKDQNVLSHGIITLDKNQPDYEFINE